MQVSAVMENYSDSDSWETLNEIHLPTDRAMDWAVSVERRNWLQTQGRTTPRLLLLVELESPPPAATSTPATSLHHQPSSEPTAANLPPQPTPASASTSQAPQQIAGTSTSASGRGRGQGHNLVAPRPLHAATLSRLGSTLSRPSTGQVDLTRRETRHLPQQAVLPQQRQEAEEDLEVLLQRARALLESLPASQPSPVSATPSPQENSPVPVSQPSPVSAQPSPQVHSPREPLTLDPTAASGLGGMRTPPRGGRRYNIHFYHPDPPASPSEEESWSPTEVWEASPEL